MRQVSVFTRDSYPEFVREWIKSRPGGGRGELMRLAENVGIHTSTLSQILAGKKHFTLEQAEAAAEFFGLNQAETRFFILLVGRERAGTSGLRRLIQGQIDEGRSQSSELEKIIPKDRPLSVEEKAIFYSNWYYTAVWAQTSVLGYGTVDSLEQRFSLPRKLVNEITTFLLNTGLCKKEAGAIVPGHQYTHLEAKSPLISRHHANWRIKAMERHPNLSPDEVSYTSPMTLSKEDAIKVRGLIVASIAEINKIRDPSLSEQLYCLNVDWFKV